MTHPMYVITNTVEVSEDCAREIFDLQEWDGQLWRGISDLRRENGHLVFNREHYDGMDYIESSNVSNILKKYKVKGDICFGGHNAGSSGALWGYRFDGEGNMSQLEGQIVWENK